MFPSFKGSTEKRISQACFYNYRVVLSESPSPFKIIYLSPYLFLDHPQLVTSIFTFRVFNYNYRTAALFITLVFFHLFLCRIFNNFQFLYNCCIFNQSEVSCNNPDNFWHHKLKRVILM